MDVANLLQGPSGLAISVLSSTPPPSSSTLPFLYLPPISSQFNSPERLPIYFEGWDQVVDGLRCAPAESELVSEPQSHLAAMSAAKYRAHDYSTTRPSKAALMNGQENAEEMEKYHKAGRSTMEDESEETEENQDTPSTSYAVAPVGVYTLAIYS